MAMTWTPARAGAFQDAYLDWSRLVEKRRDALHPARPSAGTDFEPIFVRLTSGTVFARQSLRDLVQDVSAPLLMDAHELATLNDRIDSPDTHGDLPDEYALYRRVGTPDSDHAALFEVLDTGVPVRLAEASPQTLAPAAPPPADTQDAPIIAILDDGLGFLNARFRRTLPDGAQVSRFHALWLQTLEQRGTGPHHVVSGKVLSRDQITALFQGVEAESYAKLNADLYGADSPRAVERGRSHGTHMLDLAAGADPADAADPVRDWPLLGVQLPPQAIEDTSGTRMESYLIQGLRWILRQAAKVNPDAPVVVNISLGFLAGPKDGTRFAEYQMAQEAAHWETVTGQPVRLVWAFGNNRLGRLVGQITCTETAQAVTWRAQPCDQTANYMEIRTPGQNCGALALMVTTPGGQSSGPLTLEPGQMASLEKDGAPVARLYHVAARDFGQGIVSPGHYVLALAPTENRKPTEPCAPAGAWQVAVQHTGKGTAQVVVQVQRDDDLHGARGRQSYLDAPSGYEWDTGSASYRRPAADGPLCYAGSHSALASSTARQVFCVGAAEHAPRTAADTAENYRAAPYSGEGAAWSVSGPTVSTLAEESQFLPGVLAAGTFSGTTHVLNGTSAAAARLTRALGLSAERIKRNAKRGNTLHTDDLDTAKVARIAVPPDQASRLGTYLVQEPHRRLSRF
ncbi:S8 family serine peptidase [Tropicibacter naphthalenivorans]|uniref:Peptidase S8/S53 domain-containing protein n=1 Tax=Tropicibacter naphthalenivorans TaxID=441103 RepID=A0A0P1GB29_9RHOB|nr:S8 family serine peptidase [Tropicibacter naphthalenivorans]CUH78596.1 hypothetical protein TRN7648_02059 [Tropicibacter naphthalenivorans]SMC81001.1 Subtilase family protein [Tropicibacter naphthalenivorans]